MSARSGRDAAFRRDAAFVSVASLDCLGFLLLDPNPFILPSLYPCSPSSSLCYSLCISPAGSDFTISPIS